MSEHWRNSPFQVTRAAAIGYTLYFVLFGPYVGFSTPISWAVVIGGGTVLLCIIAAIEVRIMRQRRNRGDQPPAPDSDATSEQN